MVELKKVKIDTLPFGDSKIFLASSPQWKKEKEWNEINEKKIISKRERGYEVNEAEIYFGNLEENKLAAFR